MRNPRKGMVYLVGGGPGDPGLITLRGLECLRQAEVVVHDRLVNRSLLGWAPQAEWIDVGKQPEHHPVRQEQINQLLVDHARAGKVVVRLKGGDPFVFGRGGEEALALADNRLPFEIVPGVTSAIAAPAYAGIPVTQRGQSCSVTFITGHRADNCGDDPSLNWRRAVQGADTVVFLMGVGNLPRIVEQALQAGKAASTPVAVVQQGTTADQKTVAGTLATIVELATQIRPPAVIVIGEVAANRESLRWYDLPEARPLLGMRILNTLPAWETPLSADSAVPYIESEFSRALRSAGAEPVEFPACRLSPVRLPVDFLAGADQAIQNDSWLFFSDPQTVGRFFECLKLTGIDIRRLNSLRIAALGEPARRALGAAGVFPDAWGKSREPADTLTVTSQLKGAVVYEPLGSPSERSLWAEIGDPERNFIPLPVYQAEVVEPEREALVELEASWIDAVVFFTPQDFEMIRRVLARHNLEDLLLDIPVVCAGRETEAAVREAGYKAAVTSPDPGIEPVIHFLAEAVQAWRKH